MREQTQNTAQVIEALKGLSRTTDNDIAMLLGLTRSGASKALAKARDGEADLSIEHVARIADGFGVPLYVMFLPYQDALRWIVDNKPILTLDLTDDQGKHRSGWHERTMLNGLRELGLAIHPSLRFHDVSTVVDLR